MLSHINFHIWFKVCKPIKRKYKLSTNCLLVLNGSYVLFMINSSDFTRRKLLDFVSYYDNVRLGKYITVLISHGYIIESGMKATRQLYRLSEKGLIVIKELNESYELELYKFCSLYGISL